MRFSLIFAMLLLAANVFCQQQFQDRSPYKNSVQFWLGGPGLAYSVNYERISPITPKFSVAGEMGAAVYPASSGIIGAWIPISMNLVFFESEHHLELGAGVVFTQDTFRKRRLGDFNSDYFANFRVGYRFQRPSRRFVFRAVFTPFYEMYSKKSFFERPTYGSSFAYRFHPWGGMSFGYRF